MASPQYKSGLRPAGSSQLFSAHAVAAAGDRRRADAGRAVDPPLAVVGRDGVRSAVPVVGGCGVGEP